MNLYADIENNDYFTVLNLKKQLSGDLDNFSNEISNLIHDTKTAIEQKLAEERRIQQAEREREQAEERERQERRRQEEERRRKNELLKRLEQLERTLPSKDEILGLCIYLKSLGYSDGENFDKFVGNRIKTSFPHLSYIIYEDIHKQIDNLKKSIDTISERDIEIMCEKIEDISILLELKRDWKKINRMKEIKPAVLRIIIGLIVGVVVGFIGIGIIKDSSVGVVIPSLCVGCAIALIWNGFNTALGDDEDTSSLKTCGVFIICFIFCIIFIKNDSNLVRMILSLVLFTLLAIFLKREE